MADTGTALDARAIQRQIDAAAPGTTIELPAGRVAGPLVLGVGPLTLRGAPGHATVIDGGGRHVALAVEASDGVIRVEGLAIVSGQGEVGGGISCANGATLEVIDCRIVRCVAARGGAIGLDDGAVRVERSTIEDNEAEVGGALYVGEIGSVHVIDSAVRANRAARGAALACVDGARATLERTAIEANTASEAGHALFARGSSTRAPRVTFDRVTFADVPEGSARAIHNDPRFPALIRLDATQVPE